MTHSKFQIDLKQIKFPNELVYFESPKANTVLILNPEVGTFRSVNNSDFTCLKKLMLNQELEVNEILVSMLSQLIVHKILYYGNFKPIIDDKSPIVPRSVYWETTHGCTLRCVYCYMNADTVRPGELSQDEAIELIDQISELGSKRLVFTGGEAMIRKDLFDLAAHAKRLGLKTELITNATLIKDLNAAKQIKECFDKVIVSLDGCAAHNDVHRGSGSFEFITHGLRMLNDAGVFPLLNSVVSDANIDHVDELFDFVEDNFSVESHRAMSLSKLGRGHDVEHELNWQNHLKLHNLRIERVLAKLDASPELLIPNLYLKDFKPAKNCGMGSGEIYIDSQGRVYPCKLVTTASWYSGSVKETSLKSILSSAEMVRARDISVEEIKGCRSCIIRRLCGGGCRGNHMGISGDALSNDPEFCWQLRHQMITQLWIASGHLEAPRDDLSILPKLLKTDEIWVPEIGSALPNSVLSSITRHLSTLSRDELSVM